MYISGVNTQVCSTLAVVSDSTYIEPSPIGTVVTAKTGVKEWSTGQGVFLPPVKRSRIIFVTWYCSQTVKSPFADVNFGTVKQSRAFLQCGQAVTAKMTVKFSAIYM